MAIYHLNIRSIGRSTHAEGTAGAHIGYITRSGACRMVLGEHMPIPEAGTKGGKARAWLDEQEASDRKNARVIDKINIGLPVELDEAERVELVRTFMAEVTGAQVPWVAAIHDKGKDAANPHAHIALRDRHIETGKRHVGMSERGAADKLREKWEQVCNEALERKGCEDRIDRRGLRVQRIEKLELAKEWQAKDPAVAAAYAAEAELLDRKPQLSVGPVVRAIDRRGKRSTVTARATRARESLTQRLWVAFRGRDAQRTPESSRRAAQATREALRGYMARAEKLGAVIGGGVLDKITSIRTGAVASREETKRHIRQTRDAQTERNIARNREIHAAQEYERKQRQEILDRLQANAPTPERKKSKHEMEADNRKRRDQDATETAKRLAANPRPKDDTPTPGR